MTIKFYEMGPGVLRLDVDPADPVDPGGVNVTAQLRSCSIEVSENVTRIEAKPTLSGEELPASEKATFSAVLKGRLIQDLDAAGVVEWSWANRGQRRTFVFVPNDTTDRGVNGELYPVPITIGGDVGDTSPEADISWRIYDFPGFGDFDNVTFDIEPTF